MFKTFYSISDWRNDPFFLQHWLFWIQSNFQATKKKQTCQIKMLTGSKRSPLVHFTQNSGSRNKQAQSTHRKFPPWACDRECAEACAERFSALKFLNTYCHLSGSQFSLLIIYFRDGPNSFFPCTKVWHKPIRYVQVSFVSSQKTRRHNHSCQVWTEALHDFRGGAKAIRCSVNIAEE